jgi:hypothetical protein
MAEQIVRFYGLDEHHDGPDREPIYCVTLGTPDNTVAARHFAYQGYFKGAGVLLDFGGDDTELDLGNPLCFLGRHAIELALKIPHPGKVPSGGQKASGHELLPRLDAITDLARPHEMTVPPRLRQVVLDFHGADPNGQSFRFAADAKVHKHCCVERDRLREGLAEIEVSVNAFLLPLARLMYPNESH